MALWPSCPWGFALGLLIVTPSRACVFGPALLHKPVEGGPRPFMRNFLPCLDPALCVVPALPPRVIWAFFSLTVLYPWESLCCHPNSGSSWALLERTLPIPVVAVAAFMVVTTFDSEPPAHISGWRARHVCQPQHIQDSADLVP